MKNAVNALLPSPVSRLVFALLWLPAFPRFGYGQNPAPNTATTASHLSIRTEDLAIRDPFIYANPKNETYYLYRSGNNPDGSGKVVEVYTGTDLKVWKGPRTVFALPPDFWAKEAVWAPEMHPYLGKYYLFVTFTSKDTLANSGGRKLSQRGTQVLVADAPEGPFRPFANNAHTPRDWMALDGTFYQENGKPWLVFCHEWIQLGNGTLEAVRLKNDLSATEGAPVTLFKATDAPWVKKYAWSVHEGYVTDGPFLYKTNSGSLLMIWSSYGEKDYAVGVAVSASGKLAGPWKQQAEPLFKADGGHGMIFRTFDGKLMLALHQPNTSPMERLHLFKLAEKNGRLILR